MRDMPPGKLTIDAFMLLAEREEAGAKHRAEQLDKLGREIEALIVPRRRRRNFSLSRFLDWVAFG